MSALPIPEPSAAERRSIPAAIKKALHLTLNQQEKEASARAQRPRLLIRCASAGLALAACLGVCFSLVHAQGAQDARLHEQAARINAQIDRVAKISAPLPEATPSDTTLLQMPSDALNALAALSPDGEPAAGDADDADYSAPPGSY